MGEGSIQPGSNSSHAGIVTDLGQLKAGVGNELRNVDVVVQVNGKKFQVTFFNVNGQNFDQIVTKEKIRDYVATALSHKVGEKYQSADISNDEITLHRGANSPASTDKPADKSHKINYHSTKLQTLENLRTQLNASSSREGEYRIKERFAENRLTDRDRESLKQNHIDERIYSKYIGPNGYKQLEEKIAALKEHDKKFKTILDDMFPDLPHSARASQSQPSAAQVTAQDPADSPSPASQSAGSASAARSRPESENVRRLRELLEAYSEENNDTTEIAKILESLNLEDAESVRKDKILKNRIITLAQNNSELKSLFNDCEIL